MKIGRRRINFEETVAIMGILNVTPDSFSDGGQFVENQTAIKQVQRMIEAGVDIIDIGGESTRPGHVPVTVEEELNRVLPIIRAIKEKFEIAISIDTSKAEVARQAIEAGADMVNDVWGLRKDPAMASVIAKAEVPCCLMHNKEVPVYKDLIDEIKRDLQKSVTIALEAGIKQERIMLDPGIGFGKTVEDNLKVMANLEELTQLGYPLLLGTSRKSLIGKVLDLPIEERLEGTLATTVIGVLGGVKIFRVHDVKENKRVLDMTRAIGQGR